jgi:hypothetical protein
VIRSLIIVLGASCAALNAATAQDTGIPACDAFYKAYEACIATKIPEAQRATFRQALDSGKASIKQASTNAAARPQLEQSCTMQKQQMSQAMASYNCKWD